MDKEILKEILKEMAKPTKYEVGFVEARRIVNDGLVILGMAATDILGFAKDANATRVRRSRGAQAWFKKMYEDGWRFKGMFEYEGLKLLYGGFILMEREIPNKRLEQLIETLTEEKVIRTGSALEIDRGPDISFVSKDPSFNKKIGSVREAFLKELKRQELPGLTAIPGSLKATGKAEIEERMETTHKALKNMGYKEDEITTTEIEKVKEPKEGFEPDIEDLIGDLQKAIPSDEEQFFDETGRNAIWRGNETKAFKQWKEERD